VTVLLDLTDQARLYQALIEKSLIMTEEVKDNGELPATEALKELLDFHVATLELKRMAADLHRIAEDLLVAGMGENRRTTIDGTTVEVRRSYNRKWDNELLCGAIAACVLQGERIAEVDAVVEVIAKLLYASTQWRVTELKAIGIDDERYATRELGRATVSLQ
jgi:hypothetical protein